MKDEQVEQIVTEVLKRLLPRLGANGSRGSLIVVFTGATVGSMEAVAQLRALILGGFQLQLVFSEMAEHLYGSWVRDELAGFPHWNQMPPFTWLRTLRESRAVLVPLMSVNTLSKLSLLIADTQTGNLILHGLFMGKPVIGARNGFETDQLGRAELGFNKGRPELNSIVEERSRIVASYGCVLVDVIQLASVADAMLTDKPSQAAQDSASLTDGTRRAAMRHSGQLVTAGDVMHAHRQGIDLNCAPTAVVTPLARELAGNHGVCIVRDKVQ